MKNYNNIIIDNSKIFAIESETDVAQLLATVIFYFGDSAKIKWKIKIDAPVILKLKRVMRYKKENFVEFSPLFFDIIKNIKYTVTPRLKKQFFLFAIHKNDVIIFKSPWNVALTKTLCLFIPEFKNYTFKLKSKLNKAEQFYLSEKIKSGEYVDFVEVIKTERKKAVNELLEENSSRGQID